MSRHFPIYLSVYPLSLNPGRIKRTGKLNNETKHKTSVPPHFFG